MFGEQVTIFQSLQLTVIAMSIVFAVLFVISLIIQGFEHIFPEAKKAPVKPAVPVAKAAAPVAASAPVARMDMEELTSDEEKMIAAFVASIEAAGENKDVNYRVVSVKQLG